MSKALLIRCDELFLRRMAEHDFVDLYDYYTAPEVAHYQFWAKGEWVDDYLYAMLADEWPKVECGIE